MTVAARPNYREFQKILRFLLCSTAWSQQNGQMAMKTPRNRRRLRLMCLLLAEILRLRSDGTCGNIAIPCTVIKVLK